MKRITKTWLFIAGGAAFAVAAFGLIRVQIAVPTAESGPSPEAKVTTFAAIPPAPMIANENNVGMTVIVAPGDNPPGTEYAVQELGTGKWVDPKAGTIESAIPVWSTDTGDWAANKGGVILSNLQPVTSYIFAVTARNFLREGTYPGPAAVGLTLARPEASGPGAVANVNANKNANVNINASVMANANKNANVNINVSVMANANKNANVNKNVNANKNANVNKNVNASAASQNKNTAVVPGLFTPGIPALTRLDPYHLNLVINPNGNSFSTHFSIEETLTHKYLQFDGSLGSDKTYGTVAQWGRDSGVTVNTIPNHMYYFMVTAKIGR